MADDKLREAVRAAIYRELALDPNAAVPFPLLKLSRDCATAALAAYRRHQQEAGIVEVSKEEFDRLVAQATGGW